MNLNKFMQVAFLSLGLASFASVASVASDEPVDPPVGDQGHGTVTFSGSIIEAPCSIEPDSVDQSINLGSVGTATLLGGGTSTPINFNIKLQDCTISTLKTVKTTFTGDSSASDSLKGLLALHGGAAGAGIALMGSNSESIKLGVPTRPQSLSEGNNVLAFAAYLQGATEVNALKVGNFTSVANFTLAYE